MSRIRLTIFFTQNEEPIGFSHRRPANLIFNEIIIDLYQFGAILIRWQ
jgi:hypothetical protein